MNTNEIKNTNESAVAQKATTSETLYTEIPPISVEDADANDGISVMCVGGSDCTGPDCEEDTGGGTGDIPVTSVTVSTSTKILSVGGTAYIGAIICPENATNQGVSWYSEDTSIVTAVEDSIGCKLTGKANGQAYVVVTSDENSSLSSRCLVTVGTGVYEPDQPVVTAPAAPSITLNGRVIYWSPVANADGYKIYCYNSSGVGGPDTITGSSEGEMCYDISNMRVVDTYDIYVVAYNSAGDSGESNHITYTIHEIATPVPVIDAANKLLTWNAIPYATGYTVYYGEYIAAETTATSFDLSAYGAGTHEFRVKAYNDIMYSAKSEPVTYMVNTSTNGITTTDDGTLCPSDRISEPDTYTYDIAAFGSAGVNVKTGTLTADFTDISIEGNRMPVTIKHYFDNTASSQFASMNVGDGWYLNYMQTLESSYDGYTYTGEQGEKISFTLGEDEKYHDTDDCGYIYDPAANTMTMGDMTYSFSAFDGSSAHLISVKDKYNNEIAITYADNRIASIKDGAGRIFTFAYDGNNLLSVTAPDGIAVTYEYSGTQLVRVKKPLRDLVIGYSSDSGQPDTFSHCAPNSTDYKRQIAFTYVGDAITAACEKIGGVTGNKHMDTFTRSDDSSIVRVYSMEYTYDADMNEFIDEEDTEDNVKSRSTVYRYYENEVIYSGEDNETVSGTNLVTDDWSFSNTSISSADGIITMSGQQYNDVYAYQTVSSVTESESERGTYRLNASATITAGAAAMLNKPRVRATILYGDGAYECYYQPYISDSDNSYTFDMVFSKTAYKKVTGIKVELLVKYTETETATGITFENISLVREDLEIGLTADDFVTEDTETEEAQEEEPAFSEVYDSYGNPLTETVTSERDAATKYREFTYTNAGNDRATETDTQGNVTEYITNPANSRVSAVIAPDGAKTAYEYDAEGRVTKVTTYTDEEYTSGAEVSYTYDTFDNVTSITRDGTAYTLSYNVLGKLESIKVGETALAAYEYDVSGNVTNVRYANGDTLGMGYDANGNLTSKTWLEDGAALKTFYNYNDDKLLDVLDNLNEIRYNYTYDDSGNAVSVTQKNSADETVIAKVESEYYPTDGDNSGALRKKKLTVGDDALTYWYSYPDKSTTKVTLPDGSTSRVNTDGFGRRTFDETAWGSYTERREYAYTDGVIPSVHKTNGKLQSSATTDLVSRIAFGDGTYLEYVYDACGRITAVTDGDSTTTYGYDKLGQLIRENTSYFTYDTGGNILTKDGKTYAYTNSAWGDLLTSYGGEAITYDAQGNPLTYRGYEMSWQHGRELASMNGNGNEIEFAYDHNGIRLSKTVNGVEHKYTLDNSSIIRETYGVTVLDFIYGADGTPCGFKYGGDYYSYRKNLQGDIVAIYTATGTLKAKYTYDAWGKCTVVTDIDGIGTLNPFRYRGYYYDVETGLYYLQSRYYDAEVGRFINADDPEWIGTGKKTVDNNIFVYCKNNPVNIIDGSGYGGIDSLLEVLNSCIDVITKIIDMIGNSYNKEKKALEASVKLLTKKERRKLSDIKALKSQTDKLSKRIGWIGKLITFLTIAIGFATSYITGGNIDYSIIELSIESFIAVIELGAGKVFDLIAKFIPYVGVILGLVGGWLISYLLDKYFDEERVTNIKLRFSDLVKDARVSLLEWTKNAIKSITSRI